MNRSTAVDDSALIQRTLSVLRDATDVSLAFGGPVNSARQVLLSQFAGNTNGALRGTVLNPGRGLGGRVAAQGRPQMVNDYVRTPGISHHYDHIIEAEGLRAMVAVPVIVQRQVRAVLYGAVHGGPPLGERIIRNVVESARDLEQTLAVRYELANRMDDLAERAVPERAAERAGSGWEQVREAYAELRLLAQDVQDPTLRERVESVCGKLSALGRPATDPKAGTAGTVTPVLSPRELDVLSCVGLGWTNTQIAADLDITTETVKSYLRTASRKLGTHTRMEAVVTARRLGLLP